MKFWVFFSTQYAIQIYSVGSYGKRPNQFVCCWLMNVVLHWVASWYYHFLICLSTIFVITEYWSWHLNNVIVVFVRASGRSWLTLESHVTLSHLSWIKGLRKYFPPNPVLKYHLYGDYVAELSFSFSNTRTSMECSARTWAWHLQSGISILEILANLRTKVV